MKRLNILPQLPRLDNSEIDLLDISKRIEATTAPLLRPSKLVKVGRAQPATIQLAGQLAAKAKLVKQLPSLESELRTLVARSLNQTTVTDIGVNFASKGFNQAWDGSGNLMAEVFTSNATKTEDVFFSDEHFFHFNRLVQPAS